MSDATTNSIIEAAKTFGISTVVLCVATWLLWSRLDSQWTSRELEMQSLRSEIVSEREYVRGKFAEVIERNTTAFNELKQELRRRDALQ